MAITVYDPYRAYGESMGKNWSNIGSNLGRVMAGILKSKAAEIGVTPEDEAMRKMGLSRGTTTAPSSTNLTGVEMGTPSTSTPAETPQPSPMQRLGAWAVRSGLIPPDKSILSGSVDLAKASMKSPTGLLGEYIQVARSGALPKEGMSFAEYAQWKANLSESATPVMVPVYKYNDDGSIADWAYVNKKDTAAWNKYRDAGFLPITGEPQIYGYGFPGKMERRWGNPYQPEKKAENKIKIIEKK